MICLEESEAAAPPRLTVAVAAVDTVGVVPTLVVAATGALALNVVALERGAARVEAPTEDADRASTAARHRAEAQTMAKVNLMVGTLL